MQSFPLHIQAVYLWTSEFRQRSETVSRWSALISFWACWCIRERVRVCVRERVRWQRENTVSRPIHRLEKKWGLSLFLCTDRVVGSVFVAEFRLKWIRRGGQLRLNRGKREHNLHLQVMSLVAQTFTLPTHSYICFSVRIHLPHSDFAQWTTRPKYRFFFTRSVYSWNSLFLCLH